MAATGAMVELLLNGVWTDVTARTYLRDRITITRGRQDQGARVDPGSCTITFNNKDGRFSPRNPTGPYYGLIGRNTPVRVSAVGGTPWLELPALGPARVRATTPDAAALDITGDIDVRFDVQPLDWNGINVVELGGKWGADGQRSWHAYLNAGFLQLGWTANGTTELGAFVALGTAALTPRMCLRITLDVNNGAGGNTTVFYSGPTLAGPWTQIGTPQVSAGTTSIFNSTAALEIGDVTSTASVDVAARLYAAEVRSGIGGTVVANPDFTAQAVGATGFTDAAGRTYTVTTGGITNRHVRFVGEISAWPSRWDVSGGDVHVPVQAAGIMRRLGQGVSPLDSTLRRRITTWPTTVAYWPMEDGQGATQAYSPVPGVQPAAVAGAQMASDDSLGGSLALPVWPQGSRFTCVVPTYPASTSWQVQHVYKIDTAPGSYANMLIIQGTGTVRRWEIAFQAGSVRVRGTDNTGALTVDQPVGVGTDIIGPWTRQNFTVTQSGGNVLWHIDWTVIGVSGGSFNGSFTGTSGQVSDVHQTYAVALDNLRIGHIGVFSDAAATAFDSADTGFDGEGAAVRYVRLASEEGVPFTTPYGIVGTAALGPQRSGTFLDLLEEAQDADVGILYEARSSIALAYRTRQSLYNQTPALALDYNTKGLTTPLEPTEDDTETRNDVTISRPAGSAARLTLDTGTLSTLSPPLGVGRYATSESRNVHSDDQLLHIAGWLLHLGTVDEARYPAVTVNLTANPSLIGPACTVNLGDLISIANLPPWLPPDLVLLMAQGYAETIGWADWQITYNCTPGSPWTVGVLDTPARGQLMSSGSTLTAGVNATATALSVATTSGPLWTTMATRPGDFPFKVRIAGEVMTVTAITGGVEDAFTRTTSNGWGSASTGQAWTSTGGAAADFSTNGTTGRHSLTSVNVARVSTTGPTIADFDMVASLSTSALATGASHFVYLVARFASTTDHLAARVEFTTTATVIVSIRKRVAGTDTQLSATTTALTHTAGGLFRLRFQGSGSNFQAKAWLASGTEPDLWDTAVTDSSITAAGTVGVRSVLGTGNTNTLPITAVCDDFALTNPQAFTVTRSTNGVVKSQATSAAVQVAQPFTLAL
jgi:hypothetical protein